MLTLRPCRSFGSPLVDELTAFSLAFDTALDAAGVSPDELTVEVSSAGAERCACCVMMPSLHRALTHRWRIVHACSEVRLPRDLGRFQGIPMVVRYRNAAEGGAEATEALDMLSYDAAAAVTTWKVADVRMNRGGLKKGQPMSKKTRERRLTLPVADLLKINLLIDV